MKFLETGRIQISFGKNDLLDWSIQYYIIPFIYMLGFYLIYHEISIMYLLSIILFLIPVCDEFLTYDHRNPTKDETKELENQLKYKFPLYLSVFLDWALTYYVIYTLLTKDISIINQIIYLFAIGLLGASNINVAHELGHKVNREVDYALCILTMAKCLYSYWVPEHLYGHHKNVATPLDPATSRKNQTVYNFFKQTLVGTFWSSFNICTEQMMKKNKDIKTPYHYKNQFFWHMANNILLPLAVYKLGGFWAVFYFVIIAFLSLMILEDINYIEHYGLQRKQLADGSYEKVQPVHSWNAPHRMTNYLLFKLQRHSDHHANSQKPYQILITDDSFPTLPNGYAVMFLLALFPSTYIGIMNDILEMHLKGVQDPKIYASISKRVRIFLLKMGGAMAVLTLLSTMFP